MIKVEGGFPMKQHEWVPEGNAASARLEGASFLQTCCIFSGKDWFNIPV
jgi:hypothetical protein